MGLALAGTAFVAMAAVSVSADVPPERPAAARAQGAKGMTLVSRVQLSNRGGIGFDDLLFTPTLNLVLAPAGNTGALALIDPSSRTVTAVSGFARAAQSYHGGHDDGVTSADATGQWVFAIDRTTETLVTVLARNGSIASRVRLSAAPDYVRAVESAGEIWVTEPDREAIEVFAAPVAPSTVPTRVATIGVTGGPESLAIDPLRSRAYTHLWKGQTVAIDVASRKIVQRWSNGCRGSRGIAIDPEQPFVFVGCSEGSVTVLDVTRGTLVGSAPTSAGVDIIAYNPQLRHLYAPGASNGEVSAFFVAQGGALRCLGRTTTAPGAHCVTSDHQRQVWVCDPQKGELWIFKDSYS
jgi:DNA-binding beta-propeller fold protein YncE